MKKFLSKVVFVLLLSLLVLNVPLAMATEVTEETDVSTAVTAEDVGESASAVNNATSEATQTLNRTGTLIEIGNTTAEETTIIIRVTNIDASTDDLTVEINSDTQVLNENGTLSDLSNWIAGDPIRFTALKYTNSGQIVATELKNLAFKWFHQGRNGWIKEIRVEENEMDIEWRNQIFTLNTEETRMVAGLKNPATINDFEVGDRIRARVVEDGDQNPATWDANIIVVLRRGGTLFMRVTRWVVPARITMMPEDLSLPATIEVEVLPSKFHEQGDVNNLIGNPGDTLSIDIDEDTKLVRRFFGKAFLKEFIEGDKVRIIGRLDEETGNLVAKFIKNDSIQALGVGMHVGKVTSVDTEARTIEVQLVRTLLLNKKWTVIVKEDAKIYKGGEEISLGDIAVNDLIRVRGVANIFNRTATVHTVAVVGTLY